MSLHPPKNPTPAQIIAAVLEHLERGEPHGLTPQDVLELAAAGVPEMRAMAAQVTHEVAADGGFPGAPGALLVAVQAERRDWQRRGILNGQGRKGRLPHLEHDDETTHTRRRARRGDPK